MTLLGHMESGQKGRVVRFTKDAQGDYRARLLALGLTPGVQVHLIRTAPLGDPVEVEIRGAHISLRRAEAIVVEMEVIPHD